MGRDTRERMITAALRLLATHGLQGASLAEVLELADAPRGSVYHHFPGGKDELVAEAIARAGVRSIEILDGLDGQSPAEVAECFFASWRELLTRSNYRAGCSVAAVTIATDSPDLRQRSSLVFESWRARLADLFTQGGLAPAAADAQAVALIAASEGAVVMSRAAARIEPLDIVAKAIIDQLKALTNGTR
jgi:TetR/AcrR family transcriptional repressor of lmrAB and yxaGH operons